MGGYPAQFQTTNIPNPTPLQTALGVGTTLAGLYTGFNPPIQRVQNVTGCIMMNRTLKRPMFRMGGSSGTGITSGLDNTQEFRPGFNVGSNPFNNPVSMDSAMQRGLKCF